MPEQLPHHEHTRGDLPPALQEMRRTLEGRRMITVLVSEIDGQFFDVCASPEMTEAVVAEVQRDIELLNTALNDAGLDAQTITSVDLRNMQTLGVKLATTSIALLQEREHREAEGEEEQRANAETVVQKVSADYGAPWLPDIIEESLITHDAENKGTSESDRGLSDNVKPFIQKKILTDLYVQGRSLNALGGFWAYHSDLPWQETAHDRALSAALRTTNTVTAFILAKSGLSLEDAMRMAGDEGVKRLGHMKLSFDETEEGVKGHLSVRGQTPSELAHETIKGLLEYIVSDTSLPAEGEITEEEARQLKAYLERPATEILEGIYGPAIARAVDNAMEKLRREAKNDRALEGEMLDLLEISEGAFLSDERVYLRFVKVFSMLSTEQLSEFYGHCLRGEIPQTFFAIMRKAKEKFQAE